MVVLLAVGFISGIISGMGIGGGTILIPAVLFFRDMSQQQAQSINLLYFIPTAIIALFLHKKNNNIETGILLPIILSGLLGAGIGSLLAVQIHGALLKKLFGGFLFCMGLAEVFKKESKKESKKELKKELKK